MEGHNPVEIIATHLLNTESLNMKGKILYNNSLRVSDLKSLYLKDDDLIDNLGVFRDLRSSSFNAKDFDRSVIDYIKNSFVSDKKEVSKKLLSDEKIEINPEDFIVYVDIEADSTYKDADKFITNRESGELVKELSVLAYKHLVGPETYNSICFDFPMAKRVFDPYKINETLSDKKWNEFIEGLQSHVTCVNTCVQPKWRYDRNKDIRITEAEKYFIESSFTSKEDLQYYIDSAYHSIVDKMWSYIMLFGIKGTGKTTLIEMIIPCVGKDNYRKAPQNALKKEFNGFKKDKRLVLMDEMVADTSAAINILKSDANKEFNVEEKSQVTESVRNFVSMWIATNNISDWKFTYDERRFSVLELTKKTTVERGISDEWMSSFSAWIETDDWANAFFNYLEENKSDNFNTMAPHKTQAFFNVVYESLKPWEMKIVDEVTMGEKTDEISVASLFEESDRYQPTTHKKIIDFLENYRHSGIQLGEYKRGRSVRNSSIIPHEKYRAPINNQELSNE